jgi:hypothetical protein
MKAAFIIRFHYEEGDPRFAWRLAYFKAMVLPRILAQTHGDFDIAIRCNPAHDHEFLMPKLAERIRTFHVKGEAARYRTIGSKRYFLDFVPWRDVEDLPAYDLQMGLDSDDLIDEGYVARIMYELKKKDPGKAAHVSFQPELFDLRTLKKYRMTQRYSPTFGSAFFALYQPHKGIRYRFAYEASHLKLHEFAESSVTVEEGYCCATTHDMNESTKLCTRP